MLIRVLIFLCILGLNSFSPVIASNTGIALTYLIIPKDPPDLHGYQASLWYQPKSWTWEHVNIYLDASFGHWWLHNKDTEHRQINIYSLAPIVRYYFYHGPVISPFFCSEHRCFLFIKNVY